MAKMNESVKARWVAALRSGEYKQGRKELRRGDEHCCLGVLCDLFARESGWNRWSPSRLSERGEFQGYTTYREFGLPGAVVCIWAQLDPRKDEVQIGCATRTLFDHNDQGRTFAEIADAIEAQL